MTRWWKCDLQVATPGEPRFELQEHWDLRTPEGRKAAALDYVEGVREAGIDAIVLADHNSVAWVDEITAAAEGQGLTVFPGFELTTGSGSDGIHLIIFTKPGTGAAEIERVLHLCGFDHDHPLFNPARPDEPAPASKTLSQILDGLPQDFLAIAPHAFNDNGIASAKTVKGSTRWRALHHDRLGAVDVGDPSSVNEATWRSRFIKRDLGDFPCLPDLAFVSTSDAYSLGQLGSRFTWIRMEAPTIEGMRQAFIDHEARIICDWDSRLHETERTPNSVEHAWVKSLRLEGATTSASLHIDFDPRLTVLIGGRGAGKSTVVAGLRCLYSEISALPSGAQSDARQFVEAVLEAATITATHSLAHSGEDQQATWTTRTGSTTSRSLGQPTPTRFPVRVINQKELFERAATSTTNPFATSQNLLRLVDDALERDKAAPGAVDTFTSAVEEARNRWVSLARQAQAERTAVSELPTVAARVNELEAQVNAFDSESSRERRNRNEFVLESWSKYEDHLAATRSVIETLRRDTARQLETTKAEVELGLAGEDSASTTGIEYFRRIDVLRERVATDVNARFDLALRDLAELEHGVQEGTWRHRVREAEDDQDAYLTELSKIGLNPTAYGQVRGLLKEQRDVLADLRRRSSTLEAHDERTNEAWADLVGLYARRLGERDELLREVSERSGELRFTLRPCADEFSWVQAVRELLSLRSDGFLEEVPALARWIWRSEKGRDDRVSQWKRACVTGEFDELARDAAMRSSWVNRLRSVDPLIRTRVAAEIPDDVVSLDFLREGGSADEPDDWQPLTTGSPGQRSAAMLGFVLHHGDEPLVLDQPEDDLDTEWISELVVRQLRQSRWVRQVIVVTHNANIPVNADAERIVVLENSAGSIKVRTTPGDTGHESTQHCGPIENANVRADIQRIMEGGVDAFVRRERKYNNELNSYRAALNRPTP